MTQDTPIPETRLTVADGTVSRCPYCDRPFRSEHLRDLHVGECHGDVATGDERVADERAREAERDALFFYQLKVAVALGLIYSSSALVLMFLLG